MVKVDLLFKVDELVEQFGAEFVLENLCKSLSTDELEDNLRYLYRMFDIPFEGEDNEETEDYDL